MTDKDRQDLQALADEQRKAQQRRDAASRTKELTALIEAQRAKGFRQHDERIWLQLPDADRVLMRGLVWVLGDRAQWAPEYDEVAEWLSNNDGRGLMLIGDCGRGKTMLTRQLLPELFRLYFGLSYDCYDAKDLLKHYDEISRHKIICIDDIGREPNANVFGVRHNYFEDIVDLCEKEQKMLICSTNLTRRQLFGVPERKDDTGRTVQAAVEGRYDLRIYDRLKAITRRVYCQGESFRGR